MISLCDTSNSLLFAGDQFMTFNMHQLLHLKDSVENLGPLWSHSCFFFEDLNGDFRDLFHGTQNIDGQVKKICLYSIYACIDH